VPIFPPSDKGLDKTHKNPLWRFENPEKGVDKKALPFGKMPPGKEKYNIADDSIGGASLPVIFTSPQVMIIVLMVDSGVNAQALVVMV
jgi:hypothetical protein